MDLKCRLCGLSTPYEELVITLQSESQKVTLIDLVEYFCRVQLDRNPILPQKVCKVCKVSLESFMFFCDTIEKHQKTLQNVKSEKPKTPAVVIAETITNNEADLISDAELLNNLFDDDDDDEDLDSPVSNDETESTTSGSGVNLRRKTLPPLKPLSVVLERLDIVYVPSDTESDSEESEDEAEALKSEKRRRSPGSVEKSPGKRMRISPIKIKREKSSQPEVVVKQTVWKDFKSFHSYFEKELTEDIETSKYNLTCPPAARADDGSMYDDYAEKFAPWSAIELRCSFKPCPAKKFYSPYELLLHHQNYHAKESKRFIKCSKCPNGDFTFAEFFKHVIDKHFRHLRYCCVMCSKMFYNFTALFHHYGNFHKAFSDIKMCLKDGLLFDSYEALERHVPVHNDRPKGPRIKLEREGSSTIINNNVINCETCGISFTSALQMESHKKTAHGRKYSCDNCDLEFSSSYSLIVHRESTNHS